jgi:RecB family endonuclease NucS
MITLNKMNSTELKDLLFSFLKRKHSIVIMANCCINYSGRAEASLDYGDRIIIIKPDKTLLVHQPTGNNAVIYMRPGSQISIKETEQELILESTNMLLHELVEIKIKNIIEISSASLIDTEKVILFGTEKDMSDYIYDHPELIDKDFNPVSREEQTKYGFIDVFGYDKSNNLVVIECKRTKAGPNAPQQLRRYIEQLAKSKGISVNNIKGIVAAPDITKNAKHMLRALGYRFKKIEPPAYLKRKKEKQGKLGAFF